MQQYVISALTLICLMACTRSAMDKTVDFDAVFGYMHGQCLALKGDIPEQSLIHIRELNSPQWHTGIVGKRISEADDCYILLEDRKTVNLSQGFKFYQVTVDRDIQLAVGVLDGLNYQAFDYDYCLTSEGVSFSVRQQEQVVWQGYYYLGYDVQSTC